LKGKESVRKLSDAVAIILSVAVIVLVVSALLHRIGIRPGEGESYRIAFISEWEGDPEVYVMDPHGEHLQRLTDDPGQDSYPTWSPDGRQLAYIHLGDNNDDGEISLEDGTLLRVLDIENGKGRTLASFSGLAFALHWAPQGDRLLLGVVEDTDGNGELEPGADHGVLRAISVASGQAVILTSDAVPFYQISWSPGAEQVAFAAGPQPFSLCTVNSHGGKPQYLIEGIGQALAWAPDGQRVTYARTSSMGTELVTISAEPSSEASPVPTALTDKPLPAYLIARIVWSPQGDKLAYVAGGTQGPKDIFILDVAQGTAAELSTHINGDVGGMSPTWSPDGKHLAFSAQEGDEKSVSDIYIATVGGGVNRLRVGTGDSYLSAWRP
jgi:Tol biopolymer transport system component